MKLDYADFNIESFKQVLRWFKIESPANVKSKYDYIMAVYSKDFTRGFTTDAKQKRESASKLILETANKYVMKDYLQLKGQ